MRKTVLMLASMVLGVLLACGVALAAEITCPTGANGLCVGTPEDDTMIGTNTRDPRDDMRGLAGNDTLDGKGFKDTLQGGGGNDTLRGGGGVNTLYGDTDDESSMVRGSDVLIGGVRGDMLYGGPGDDRVLGGPGADDIEGFAPSETGSNYDTVHGQDGNDYMVGGYGKRYGEEGDDYVSAGNGDSQLFGGPGNDLMSAGSHVSQDVGFTEVHNGGPGEDNFAVRLFIGPQGSKQPPDDITYLADDGEHDTIGCRKLKQETVRADPLDTFPRSTGWFAAGREYCDSLKIVR